MELWKTGVYHRVHCADLEWFVANTLYHDYSVLAALDYPSQNTQIIYGIGECPSDLDVSKVVAEFNVGVIPSPEDVLQALYRLGHIPAGNYLLEIDW